MSLDTQMRDEWAEMDGERIRKLESQLAEAKEAYEESAAISRKWIAKAARYREALKNVLDILGPTPMQDCCEGAQAEMEGAINIAASALADEPEGGKHE